MEQTSHSELRIRVLLSSYSALLGRIHPDIRLITIDWGLEYYAIMAYFNRPVSDDDLELLKGITTEIAADIPQFKSFKEYAEYSLKPVEELKPLKDMIYLRYGELHM